MRSNSQLLDGMQLDIPRNDIIDYPAEESCLSGNFVPIENNIQIDTCSKVRIGDIFQKYFSNCKHKEKLLDQKVKENEFEFQFSEFHKDCGVDTAMVITVVYSYLARNSLLLMKNILKNYSIDLNTLAWMSYHKTSPFKFVNCINYCNKLDYPDFCVICHAQDNVITVQGGLYKITASPKHMSGGRCCMRYANSGDRHFVVWAQHHSHDIDTSDDIIKNNLKKFIPGMQVDNLETFYHGQYTYGHPHIHCFSGQYYNIRANEVMINAQKAVNNDKPLTFEDFYHPSYLFYRHCSDVGKDSWIAAYVCTYIRLKLPKDVLPYLFYRMTYPILWEKIKKGFDEEIIN